MSSSFTNILLFIVILFILFVLLSLLGLIISPYSCPKLLQAIFTFSYHVDVVCFFCCSKARSEDVSILFIFSFVIVRWSWFCCSSGQTSSISCLLPYFWRAFLWGGCIGSVVIGFVEHVYCMFHIVGWQEFSPVGVVYFVSEFYHILFPIYSYIGPVLGWFFIIIDYQEVWQVMWDIAVYISCVILCFYQLFIDNDMVYGCGCVCCYSSWDCDSGYKVLF